MFAFENSNSEWPDRLPVRSTELEVDLSTHLFAPLIHVDNFQQSVSSRPVQVKKIGSANSVQSSPSNSRGKTRSVPISPQAKRRNFARFANEDGDSKSEDDTDETNSAVSSEKMTPISGKRRLKTSVDLTASITNHTSAFRGVSCCGKDRKFQARIRDGSKVHYLGRYDNEFDAALKYDEAAREHKGDAAILNFREISDEEMIRLRQHYFDKGKTILPEYYKFLYPGTAERLEAKRRLACEFK